MNSKNKQQFICECAASGMSSRAQWSGVTARVPAHRKEVAMWLRYHRANGWTVKKTRRGYIGTTRKYLFVR